MTGPGTPLPEPRTAAPRRRRAALIAIAAVAALSAPWWGPPLLRPLSFFRVRNVELHGARYLTPADVLARLNVDTTNSVWDDPAALARRVARHPQVDSVRIGRRLPGTLIVRIVERLPVALVPSKEGLRAVDRRGASLPIDPTRVNVDLPVVPARDVPLLDLLYTVRVREPAFFDRISEARRAGAGELAFRLTDGVLVRAMSDVTVARLSEAALVERDLAGRKLAAAELDLRFRDQVIARLTPP